MANDSWATPEWLFQYAIDRYGDFLLDVCASESSAKCVKYYNEEDNGLISPWSAHNWCNPPYSNIRPWVEKAALEACNGNSTVMLLPADFSTQWFSIVWEQSSEILIINKRVRFVGALGSPKFASFFCLISPWAWNIDEPRVELISPKRFL
jgi:phage N-6-adenine-methyltransferase